MSSSTGPEMCSVCTLTSDDIGVDLDAAGLCNVCRLEAVHARTEHVGWDALAEAIAPLRGRGEYDCLVCWSGGKDSTFVVDYLARVKGLRVATFTFDNSFIAPGAFDNIERIKDRLGLHHVTVRADAEEYRASLRAALEGFSSLPPESLYYKTIKEYGPVCYLCGAIFHSVAVKLALELGCRLIATGFTVGQDSLYYADYKTQDARTFADRIAKARRPTLHTVDHWFGVGQLLRRYLGETSDAVEASGASKFFLTRDEHARAREVAMFRLFDYVAYDPKAVVRGGPGDRLGGAARRRLLLDELHGELARDRVVPGGVRLPPLRAGDGGVRPARQDEQAGGARGSGRSTGPYPRAQPHQEGRADRGVLRRDDPGLPSLAMSVRRLADRLAARPL